MILQIIYLPTPASDKMLIVNKISTGLPTSRGPHKRLEVSFGTLHLMAEPTIA